MADLYEVIQSKLQNMSKSQREIARYVMSHMNSVPFLTVGELAKQVGVGEATVYRFATYLGYSGYPEFQKALQEAMKKQLTTVEQLRISEDMYDQESQATMEMFEEEVERIREMSQQLNMDDFQKVVDKIVGAKRIFIVANRSAVALGSFLEFYFDVMLENAELIRNPHGISEKLFRIDEDDVVIGLSFSRYTRSTVEALSFAHDRGTQVVSITDNQLSPLVPYSDIALYARSDMSSLIDSFVAPLSLINALITAVGHEKSTEIQQHLEELESVWDRFNIFSDDKM
ncbi:MurR/RpiR family transcriptional regulator [Alkalibacillus almallahensis]|uniref:MurR/RpiR family transcriptional regulator n=1 Tax=Alkalibacillus almallahensis TaxID=1379154 RepID=UPI0014212B5A|nr:MurR/RpiR family transcriptional regulator [Alkalibacillus almallahensis]NIK11375.1 DNA-binding MurR/RpiR family transcriptional regulator [Alkalibacillus almallahensis]